MVLDVLICVNGTSVIYLTPEIMSTVLGTENIFVICVT